MAEKILLQLIAERFLLLGPYEEMMIRFLASLSHRTLPGSWRVLLAECSMLSACLCLIMTSSLSQTLQV